MDFTQPPFDQLDATEMVGATAMLDLVETRLLQGREVFRTKFDEYRASLPASDIEVVIEWAFACALAHIVLASLYSHQHPSTYMTRMRTEFAKVAQQLASQGEAS